MRIIIGIDPDIDKSGVAIMIEGVVELTKLRFFELFDLLTKYKGENIFVVIEGGWLNKSNWHIKKQGSASLNATIGNRTGANHETGRKIVEMLEYLTIKHRVVKPTRRKLDSKEFKTITKIKTVTNQDHRDSFMLIFGLK